MVSSKKYQTFYAVYLRVQHYPQRLRPLMCDSKVMNVPDLELYLGKGLHHEVVVLRIKKVYMHGQAQFLS